MPIAAHPPPLRPQTKNKRSPQNFAIPKIPPTEPGLKRLAIQTKDHPLKYADFEGEIPKGHYGAGTVTLWDWTCGRRPQGG